MSETMTLTRNEKLLVLAEKFTFYIVGAGGTGSYLVRDLARIISVYNEKYNRNDEIVIIDQDIVESKNLTRQNFIRNDIGKNKAEVLAKRYKNSFGINISYVPEYINNLNWNSIIQGGNGDDYSVIIGCVDNNKTRHILHNVYANSGPSTVYLDSGNEEYGGQVVFAVKKFFNKKGVRLYRYLDLIKDVVVEFDLDANDKHPEEMSCAEHALSAPQNIATNIMAANILFNYCNTMLAASAPYYDAETLSNVMNNPFYVDGETATERRKNFVSTLPMISAHITYFNSLTGQISTRPFSEEVQLVLKN